MSSVSGAGDAREDAARRLRQLVDPVRLEGLARAWLAEDVPAFDYGGAVVGDKRETATLYAKSPGVLAGTPFVDAVCSLLRVEIEWDETLGVDGAELRMPSVGGKLAVARVAGPARNILLAERVALNTLARCSGIATRSRALRELADKHQWHGRVAATRKTTPGFRLVEKYGVLAGGCDSHRMDLSSMVMLKDNHVWSTGSIPAAVVSARAACGFSIKIEVECNSLEEARDAAGAGADVIMLDNMLPEPLIAAASDLKQDFPHVLIEASGGLTEQTLALYFSEHVDILSLSIMQNYKCLDFSLKIDHSNNSSSTA
mmetsp:Transcript_14679/g.39297  ORF Transcript_14679/g.39297 Transcript_14679/m.39297 type:complete len:315 (-) Transcript_14679:631-1575(-)|eukprot:CAMPEP_0185841822 /NCGR_PEP_ID=MMETSP1353-20130828/18093_1 /TAXON_ID=1077150 /ORGANISM="Erythrolobus australicus, Strain CCMP3124" /LENGTH=314 /DNA_ID=CAMNT_0028541313 /DNA_START=45 /DNA_END=989 /DNA_ORIENTATION=+